MGEKDLVMSGFYIDDSGEYYEGDRIGDDAEVPQRPSRFHSWGGQEWIISSLDSMKAATLLKVNAEFEKATSALTAGYPPSEKNSWPNQTNEAMAWYADNATPTPYLDALAGYRGLDLVDYRQRTVNKVLRYKAASALLIGTRQKYADQIDAATTAEDLDAIVPDFTLPA
jgi:hypothetical protein